jgi:hypothetical protein
MLRTQNGESNTGRTFSNIIANKNTEGVDSVAVYSCMLNRLPLRTDDLVCTVDGGRSSGKGKF